MEIFDMDNAAVRTRIANARLVAEDAQIASDTPASSCSRATSAQRPCPASRVNARSPSYAQGANESVKSRSATPAALPDFVEPMQAKLVASMPAGDWIYEVKFDGYRGRAAQ
jgi:bifunctional non-homologous end joining protein LigD